MVRMISMNSMISMNMRLQDANMKLEIAKGIHELMNQVYTFSGLMEFHEQVKFMKITAEVIVEERQKEFDKVCDLAKMMVDKE